MSPKWGGCWFFCYGTPKPAAFPTEIKDVLTRFGTPSGDEAEYSDGRLSATGNWQAFLAYIHHPAVSPLLKRYDLGSSDSEAKHALILDREKHEIFIAPVKDAQTFLTEQWPPEPPLRMSQDEYVARISEALKNIKPPDDKDIEEINRRIEEQYAQVEARV